jgi:UDP-2,3-diacylglucosamine hydrolase
VLANKLCQWLFARLHPNFGIWLMKKSSSTSRNASYNGKKFLGEDKEWLILHAKDVLRKQHIDFFIFGHRHLAMQLPLSETSIWINLGDWITQYHYAIWDGTQLELKKFVS